MNDENLENKKQKTEDRKEDKKYPEPTIGAVIYNEKREVLLTQSPKWGDYWVIPGGHVEIGEKSKEAVKREIKEETGLEVDNIEFMEFQDAFKPEGFYQEKHFIFLDFMARVSGGEIKKSDEMVEYKWIKPENALKELDLAPYTKKAIEKFIGIKEKKDYKIKYLRALADYQNLLKQTAREKEEFAKFANEQLIMEILPVYDNLKVSLSHAGDDEKKNGWAEGIKHIVSQFKNILENIGVEEIKTTGEKFDPNTMEAVSEEETDDEKKDGSIANELSAGYKLKGKVIRAARVAVYHHITRNT